MDQKEYAMQNIIGLVGIDHVQFEVRDLDVTADFYARLFGFQKVEVGIRLGLRWAIISIPTLSLALHERPLGFGKPNPGLKITHFGIVVKEFEKSWKVLQKSDVLLDPKSDPIQYDSSRSFYFFDPDGHKIEVSEKWGGR